MFNFATWFRHVCELVFQCIGTCDTRVWGRYRFNIMFILVRIRVRTGLPWRIDGGSRAKTAAGGRRANTGSVIVRVFCCVTWYQYKKFIYHVMHCHLWTLCGCNYKLYYVCQIKIRTYIDWLSTSTYACNPLW